MTVINNAAPASDSNSGMGFLMGVILFIAFIFFLFYFGLPIVRNSFGGGVGTGSGTQINVPDKMDVNVKQTK